MRTKIRNEEFQNSKNFEEGHSALVINTNEGGVNVLNDKQEKRFDSMLEKIQESISQRKEG